MVTKELSFWKIGEFSKMLKKHRNTIDSWFRVLEEERQIHYVSRDGNDEKVYSELDFSIAQFIIKYRDMNWSLDAIFDLLPQQFTLRLFPSDYQNSSLDIQNIDINKLRAALLIDMEATFRSLLATHSTQQIDTVKTFVPTVEEQRLERLNLLFAQKKVEKQLEQEALAIWLEKPITERFVKVGLFRKVEDNTRREAFVKTYVAERFEGHLREEFGLDD